MRLLRSLLVALALWPAAAGAQGVLQNGPTANGHVPMYVGQGGQAVVQDSGPAGGGIPGYGLSELLIAARGSGLPPYAGQGTGPLGTNVCDYDGPISSAAGYHYICLSANAQGGGLITYGAGGGAAELPLSVVVNGATIPFGGQLLAGAGQIAANYAAGTNQVIASNWMASGTACPTWLSPYQLFTNTAAAPTGTILKIWDGAQCVTVGTLNETTHVFSTTAAIAIGSTVVISGTPNGLLYDSAGVVGNLATANNGALVTDGSGVPSISSTLPSAVQANITGTGTLGSGATGTGFTVNLGASTISGQLGGPNGGTGVDNGARTITVNTSSVAFTAGVTGQIGCWNAATLSGCSTPTLGVAASTLGTMTLASAGSAGQVFLSPQSANIFDVASTIASAASATLDDVKVSAETTTISGNTHITTAAGVNKVTIGQPTYSAASALTIDQAASLYIAAAPAGGGAGPATITNSWSVHTGAGHVYLQSANGTSGITDGFGASRNCGLCEQRVITSLTGTPIGFVVDLQDNNTTAAQTSIGMLTAVTTNAGNATNKAAMTGWILAVESQGTGTISAQTGANFQVGSTSAGTVTLANALTLTVVNNAASSALTASNALSIPTPSGTASGTATWGAITGISISDQKPSGAGTNTLTNPPIGIAIASQTAAGAFAIKQSGSGINQFDSSILALAATAIPAGGTAGAGFKFSSTSNFGIFFGSGAPTLSAAKGSLYLRSDGSSTSTRAYINTDGGTTWTNITTGA